VTPSEESQEIAAMRAAARKIAHDLNNVLAAVKGNADLLLMELPEGDHRYEDAEEIIRAVDRAVPLVEQLFELSRTSEPDTE
jgi:nitrogen-specific signal transduction histidine kinase